MFFRTVAVLAAVSLVVSTSPGPARAHGTAHVSVAEASPTGPIRFRLRHGAEVPYRAFVLVDPPRLVIDRAGGGIADVARLEVPGVTQVQSGWLDQDWHRTIVTLSRPMLLTDVVPRSGDLTLVLRPARKATVATAAALAPPVPQIAPPAPAPVGDGRVRIVIDPGHGGIDPGARRAGVEEKDLTLSIAQRLASTLSKSGRYEVLLTRHTDRFVLLDDRVAFARQAGAALFLSLHANTVEVGVATGATVHIPARDAVDPAAAALAVIENRSDAAAGGSVAPAADDIAQILHDMARPVTEARAHDAAERIVAAFRQADVAVHRRPIKRADFRVLRAPDMPSVLIELGFLTNDDERRRMTEPAWQDRVAQALAVAVDEWIAADRAFLTLMQQ